MRRLRGPPGSPPTPPVSFAALRPLRPLRPAAMGPPHYGGPRRYGNSFPPPRLHGNRALPARPPPPRAPHAPGAARAAPLRRRRRAARSRLAPGSAPPLVTIGSALLPPRPVIGWQRKGRGQAWERGHALAAFCEAIRGAGTCAAQ